ncbi:MAG: S-methyl-5'-thioadenosine phosphorylase [Myxococcales bacterium]|nr:S-methyl-5'-thioadenosine phosphorylase [Myxococcales bacterium]
MIGVIGGSGVYQVEGLEKASWRRIRSAFGEPSDELLFGELDGEDVVFLPRHGRGHRIPPTEVNYRANIDALKRVGVTDVISLSAVGSLKEELPPGTFVLVDQFIDRTFAREKSFFGTGLVGHVSMAHPVCKRVGDVLEAAATTVSAKAVRGGTYLVMEGPQFSSKAESELYRSWKCDVVGMTNMPEAKLAREAEICYATVAMVTDYDCWHPSHDHVTVEDVVRVMQHNGEVARALVKAAVQKLAESRRAHKACPERCDRCLDVAIMTSNDARDPVMETKLAAILERVREGRT